MRLKHAPRRYSARNTTVVPDTSPILSAQHVTDSLKYRRYFRLLRGSKYWSRSAKRAPQPPSLVVLIVLIVLVVPAPAGALARPLAAGWDRAP